MFLKYIIKNLPTEQKTHVQSLEQEDPLWIREWLTHSSILALRIQWTEEPGSLQSMGLKRVGHNWANFTGTCHLIQTVFHEFESLMLNLSKFNIQFSSIQSLSHARFFVTPWIAACQASLSITNSRSSLRLTTIKSVMPSSHLILCRPLLILPPIPTSIRVFSNELILCMRWPKYWSFSFSISPSKEHPGLISFRMDWLDLLAVKGLSRVFSNTTVQKHQFFGAQLSSQSNSHIHTWPQEKP